MNRWWNQFSNMPNLIHYLYIHLQFFLINNILNITRLSKLIYSQCNSLTLNSWLEKIISSCNKRQCPSYESRSGGMYKQRGAKHPIWIENFHFYPSKILNYTEINAIRPLHRKWNEWVYGMTRITLLNIIQNPDLWIFINIRAVRFTGSNIDGATLLNYWSLRLLFLLYSSDPDSIKLKRTAHI